MRTLITASLCAIALMVASCSDTPTTTSDTTFGKTTLDDFLKNSAYKVWYTTGYDSYPLAADKAAFDQSVAQIRTTFDSTQHQVIMVVKPNCGCQTTQLWMPRIMKALDAAGVPHTNIVLYSTDSRLTGVDNDARVKYKINDDPNPPMFIVMKGNSVEGRVNINDLKTVPEQDLAKLFAQP